MLTAVNLTRFAAARRFGSISAVNRGAWIDSYYALDQFMALPENPFMTRSADCIHLRRYDPTRNMARFYRVTLEATLFGEIVIRRNWGRIGTRGQSREFVVPTMEVALRVMGDLRTGKLRRGYRPS